MTNMELLWLAAQAEKSSSIAEIGCWKGRTTCALAEAARGVVYAIDTWKGSEEHQQTLKAHDAEYLWRCFSENVAKCSRAEVIRPMRMTSLEAAALLTTEGVKLDMIFIDASHDYESVRADILAWRPLLADGGVFCGHDFHIGRPAVMRAVEGLVGQVHVPAGSIWVARDKA